MIKLATIIEAVSALITIINDMGLSEEEIKDFKAKVQTEIDRIKSKQKSQEEKEWDIVKGSN